MQSTPFIIFKDNIGYTHISDKGQQLNSCLQYSILNIYEFNMPRIVRTIQILINYGCGIIM